MSEPCSNYKDKIHGAILEIISGISALNMDPKPIATPKEGAHYLSELDEWAEHSLEHFRQAIALLREVDVDKTREDIILDCQKLYARMGKLRASGHPNDSRLSEALFYYIRYGWNEAELEHKA